uniref:Argininosuccinate lyase n=1 Tax=candidate division WOR-3 bacterium TaxID=2052148 RepID=A0A7V3KNI7_UNCW3
MVEKLWQGRFEKPTNRAVEKFTASIEIDKRLYPYDIMGSIAHTKMLGKQGILSEDEVKLIVRNLKRIKKELDEGTFIFHEGDEDIHMAIERSLIERIGEVGGKLHTGRSRNDQIALDERLFLREEVKNICSLLEELKSSLLRKAKEEIHTVMPGYTHLQRAQPVLLSHYFLAYWEMLDRDENRMKDCLKRINVMPLGSAALAGTGIPLDRKYTARILRFPVLSKNSMDAVADRDFLIEFISASSLLMMHLSRFCEDLIIWNSGEFSFVAIDDAFATGSSIMPQKKNPDVAELIRGKTARIYGNLIALLTLLKGLPMTYNRDLQEDKVPLFDTVDQVKSSLSILTPLIDNLSFQRDRLREAAMEGFSTATDLAEYLVKKGISFRAAHHIAGKIVAYCLKNNKTLFTLTLKEYRNFHEAFDEDILDYVKLENAINVRKTIGGTAGERVLERIKEIEELSKSENKGD